MFTLAALEAAYLAELRTSPISASSISPLLLSFRLFILGGWLVAGMALLFLRPRALQRAAGLAEETPSGTLPLLAALGTSAVLAGILFSTLLLLWVPPRAALPLVALVAGSLALAKIFGLAALFVALGRRMTRRVSRSSPLFGDPAALATGLVTLGVVSLLPGAGAVAWAAASLVGIGLALKSWLESRASA